MKGKRQYFTLVLFILAFIAQGVGQVRSDAEVIEAVLPELRAKTQVPLMLPTYLGNEQTEEWPLYAIIEEATPTRYFVQIAFSPDCSGGTACRWGGVTGKKVGPTPRRPAGKPVKLTRGLIGYFVDSTCGANCSDSVLTWDQGGYRYTVESKAASADFLRKVANSAIDHTTVEKNVSGSNKELFSSIDEFLKKVGVKSSDGLVSANGDLNGDSVPDWAGSIQRSREGPSDTAQLWILIREGRDGPFRLAATTGSRVTSGNGCCWVEDIRIENSSLYVQHNEKTHGTMEAATHQFKLYKGAWRLVGVRVFNLDVGADTSVLTDSNVLTGRVVITKEKGEKTTGRTTRKKIFLASYLKDYDFDNTFGLK